MAESNTTYERRVGVDASHGIDFEWQTTNLAYLRCEKLHRQWVQDNTLGVKSYFVANNVDGIGAFDDVVIRVEYTQQNVDTTKLIFVQCKHSANPKNCSFEKFLKCATVQKYFDSFIEVLRVLNDNRALSCQTYNEIKIRKETKRHTTKEMERNAAKEHKLRNFFQCKPQDCEFILYSNMILDAGLENTQTQQDNDISMKILNTAQSNVFNVSLNAEKLEFLPNEQFSNERETFEELKKEFATKFRIIVNQADNINVDLLKSIIPAADIRGIYPLLEEEVKCKFQNIPSTAITENSELLENIENFSKLKTIAKNELESFLHISEHGNLFLNEFIENWQNQFDNEEQTKICTSSIELEKLKLKQYFTNKVQERKLLVFIKDENDLRIWTKARKSRLYRNFDHIFVCLENMNMLSGYAKDNNEVFIEIHQNNKKDSSFNYAQFSHETSKLILNHAIIFQSYTVTVNDICGDEWRRLLDEETICKILRGEEITIGSKFFDSLDCYMERKLQLKEKNEENSYRVNKPQIMDKYGKSDTNTLTEDDIIEEENKKVFLLTGPAGIGKSTTLKSLALKYKKQNPKYFVYLIELNKYLNVLKKYKEDCDVAGAIEFLAQKILSLQQLEYRLFVYACAENKNVALFFDAFDEISPDGEKKFSSFLETLLKAHVSSIFVSSRPNFIGTLEQRLKQESLIFVPFSLVDKKKFFLKYYEKLTKQNATTNDTVEMKNVISRIIKTMEEETELMAIPLQITMLAEIYFEKFSDMTTEEKMSFSIKMDICSLYNAFIEKLVVRFLVEKKKLDLLNMQDKHRTMEIENTMRDAEELACKLICPDINQTPLAKYDDAVLKMCNQVGLITNIDPPVFLHRTYGEFLAANWFVQCIKNEKQNSSSYVSFLCKNILLKREYREIRRFINTILRNSNSEKNDSHIINSDVKILFDQYSNGTSLHVAAEENHTEILKLLVNNDPSMLNKLKYNGYTAVDIACEYNNTEAVQYLLPRTDSTLILKGERNKSILHFAATTGNLIITNLIMEKFPQLLNQKDSHGCTALHYACKRNNTKVVELLLSHDNCQINVHNDEQENPLHYASEWIYLEVMQMLLDRDISLLNIQNKKGQTLLHLKLSQNRFHYFGRNGMIKIDSIEASKYLLSLNCSVNMEDINGMTPLHLASMRGYVEIIKRLLQRDGTLLNQQDKRGRTPLHCVFEIIENDIYGTTRYESVSCLLNFPECDINLPDNEGNTPLHYAAWHCYDDDDKILPLCIQRDEFQLNVQNKRRQTALHLAVSNCNFEKIKVLLSHEECKVNTQDKNGDTPFHLISFNQERIDDDERIMNTIINLIKHDSSILNIKNHNGQTPLHIAVKYNRFKVADLLVRLGADVNIKDNDNRTPLELARWLAPYLENDIGKGRNRRIIEILRMQSAGTATTEPPSGVEEIE